MPNTIVTITSSNGSLTVTPTGVHTDITISSPNVAGNTSMSVTGSGGNVFAVALATNSGLVVSSGLKIKIGGAALGLDSAGLFVTLDKIVQVYGPLVPWVVEVAAYLHMPSGYVGTNLISVHAWTPNPGTTGVSTIQIIRTRSGTPVNMLSTALTIDSTENGSDTAATAAVIDTGNDDIALHDILSISITGTSTTAPTGLVLTLEFA